MFDEGIFCGMEIFHLAEPSDWAARTDVYVAPSLQSEGFIHCSTADQVSEVAQRFFVGREDLILLTIDTSVLTGSLVHEDLYGTGEEFSHIYGPIPLAAVVGAEGFPIT